MQPAQREYDMSEFETRTYEVRRSDVCGELLDTVDAISYEWAATKVLRRMTRNTHIGAERVTGEFGKSGCFQGYVARKQDGALNSCGPRVHVSYA